MNVGSVSVIVPAIKYDRATEITIEHLLKQRGGQLPLELHIVSPDRCPPQFANQVKWHVINEAPSAANSRNLGMAKAKGDLLIFLDADMIVSPAFIADHVRAHALAESPILCRGLRCEVDDRTIPEVMASERTARWNLAKRCATPSPFENEALRFFERPGRFNETGWVYCISANLSIARKDANEHGLDFDSGFHEAGCEDTDFGFRAHRSGIRMRLSREAVAYHIHSSAKRRRDPSRLRRNIVRFQQKHSGEPVVQSVARRMLSMVDQNQHQKYLYGDCIDESTENPTEGAVR